MRDILQPVQEALADFAPQEIEVGKAGCRAIAMAPYRGPIEDSNVVSHAGLPSGLPLSQDAGSPLIMGMKV